MKTIIFVLLLAALADAGPARARNRFVFERENDPDFKRYVYVENKEGGLDLVDLKAGNVTVRAVLSDVTYYLLTRSNSQNPDVITNGNVSALATSSFDPSKLSLFVSHGWNNNNESAVNALITAAALEMTDVNVFVVDWSGPANRNYLTAKAAVPEIGQFEGRFINDIMATYGLPASSFILIGHSLGAHVAGCAGAVLTSKVDIIGLDPAGPLYTLGNIDNRLDASDGAYVQIIHTHGLLLGFYSEIGHADYYPNGGWSQPGCGLDVTGSCSHGRSYRYLAESIRRGEVFKATLCSDYRTYEDGKCDAQPKSFMGKILIDEPAEGSFYLETNSEEPWGKDGN